MVHTIHWQSEFLTQNRFYTNSEGVSERMHLLFGYVDMDFQ